MVGEWVDGWEGEREDGWVGGREAGWVGGRERGEEERDMLASPYLLLSSLPLSLPLSLSSLPPSLPLSFPLSPLSSFLPSSLPPFLSLSPLVYPAQRRGSKRGRFDEPPAKKHLFISLSRRGTSSEYAKGKYVGYW